MANLKNVITIQQGANWLFSINIYDDTVYKTMLLDFLAMYQDLYTPETKIAIELVLGTDIHQDLMKLVIENLLAQVITPDMQIEIDSIFEEMSTVSLLDKEVKIHLAIFKAPNSNRTINFNYTGTATPEGAISFDIPACETFNMIYKTNREHTDLLLGFYTIELTDTLTNNVIRILEGDCIISRGAKHDCIISPTE